MKNLQILAACVLFFFASCDSEGPFESEFEKSLDVWTSEKKEFGNSYAFTIRVTSVFGFGSSTKITVRKGEVFSREYESFRFDEETQTTEITNSWVENQSELNSHSEGAKPMTLDEIYGSCKTAILSVNEDENFIFFRAENNGILSTCSYVPKNCADDCAMGFNIVSFEWLNL